MGLCRADRVAHRLALVAAEVVHHQDVSGTERGQQEVLDIGPEGLAIDRPVQHEGRIDPVVTQGGDEGPGPPGAMRSPPDQALALRRPASERRHVGLGPYFIDEDKAARVDPALVTFPAGAAAAYVRAVLLFGQCCLF